MQGVARNLNLAKAAGNASAASNGAATLRALGAMLGVLQQDPDTYLKRSAGNKSFPTPKSRRCWPRGARRAPSRILPNRTGSATS